jgi:hypothetical protein
MKSHPRDGSVVAFGSCLLILSFWRSAYAWMNLWIPALIGIVLLFIMARLFFRDCFEFPLPAQRLGEGQGEGKYGR